MDDKVLLKQNKLNEIHSLYNEINDIMKNSSHIGSNWNDPVSISFQNKINEINKKKTELTNEIQKLENFIKNDSTN